MVLLLLVKVQLCYEEYRPCVQCVTRSFQAFAAGLAFHIALYDFSQKSSLFIMNGKSGILGAQLIGCCGIKGRLMYIEECYEQRNL